MSDDSDDEIPPLSREGFIDLPHYAFIDIDNGVVNLPIDRVVVSFTIEEFENFCTQITDIRQVFDQVIKSEEVECPTCGTSFEQKVVTSPTEDDYN